jgi:hypothetical protein
MARTVPDHGPGSVPEKRILPWIQAEAARMRLPDVVEIEMERRADRDRLEARRTVIEDMYEANGPTWRDEYQRRMAALKVDEAKLDEMAADTAVLSVPSIDWAWPAEQVNKVLRAMWEYVELDEAMQPVEAQWLIPEWRA